MRIPPCLRANSAFLDIKLVAARGSVVDLPCLDTTRHTSVAKWATVDEGFAGHASFLHVEALPARTAVIYFATAHGAGHRPLTKRAHISKRFLGKLLYSHRCAPCIRLPRGGCICVRPSFLRFFRLCGCAFFGFIQDENSVL